jgi:hypothetical protein
VKDVAASHSPKKTLSKDFEGLKSTKLDHPNNEIITEGHLYYSQSESRIRQSLHKSIERSKMEKQYSAPSLTNDYDKQAVIEGLLKNLYEFGDKEDQNIAEALEVLFGGNETSDPDENGNEATRIISDLPDDRMLTVDPDEDKFEDRFDDELRVLTANMKKRPSLAKAYEKSLERSNSLTSAEIIIDIANKIYINNNEKSIKLLKQRDMAYRVVNLNVYNTEWEKKLIKKDNVKVWINDRLDTCIKHVDNLKNNASQTMTNKRKNLSGYQKKNNWINRFMWWFLLILLISITLYLMSLPLTKKTVN